LVLDLEDPRYGYAFDPREKDKRLAADEQVLRFRRAEMKLRDKMPPGMVLFDVKFIDGTGTRVFVKAVDLMCLVPRIDLDGNMQYPELLLEEYGRFGITLRRELDEFHVSSEKG